MISRLTVSSSAGLLLAANKVRLASPSLLMVKRPWSDEPINFYKVQVHGFRRETPVDAKSLVFRVTTVIPCTSAVAAIRPSRTGRGSGT